MKYISCLFILSLFIYLIITGIALDEIKWASVTQFKNHYNASHPLVLRNMRRNRTVNNYGNEINDNKNLEKIVLDKKNIDNVINNKNNNNNNNNNNNLNKMDSEEFWNLVPKYPNDGVLLIDVQKYNKLNILNLIEEIAATNGRGEYVVGKYVRVRI